MTFEATIWEKAEHWTFTVTIEATDENAARKTLMRDYPAKHYTIRDLRQA